MPDKPALVYPPTFWALVEQVAGTEPEGVILSDDRGRRLTNRDYATRCEATAAALSAMGSGRAAVSWQCRPCSKPWSSKVRCRDSVPYRTRSSPSSPARGRVHHDTDQAELLIVPGVWRGFDYTAMAEDVHPKSLRRDHRSCR